MHLHISFDKLPMAIHFTIDKGSDKRLLRPRDYDELRVHYYSNTYLSKKSA